MDGQIDLHIHTTASDGTDAPASVAEQAAALGLRAIAITDHDTVSGVGEAVRAGRRLGVEVIPGIEVSADYRGNKAHIVGLFIDPAAEALRPVTEWAENQRLIRNRRIVGALEADGFDISMEALEAEYPASVLGRPHIAEHLMKKGYTASVQEGFDRYVGKGRPYYFPRERMSLAEAAACIGAAGGAAFAAHPLQYGYGEAEREEFLKTALDAGCVGFEAYYSEHTPEEQAMLLALADRLGVPVSGGSDYHGTRKPRIRLGSGIDGSLAVPYSVLEALRRALKDGAAKHAAKHGKKTVDNRPEG